MPMTNEECIQLLLRFKRQAEDAEEYLLQKDADDKDIRDIEMEIEVFERCIRALREKRKD